MAYTNLHKNLPDREIHPPKKFNTASSSSVLTKSLGNEVEWAGASYTVQTVITCSADVSGITGGRYFILPLKSATYQVWFDVDDTDSCIINSRHTGLEIDISANDTASTIASALKTELNAISGVTASNASEKVTITIDADTVSVSASQDGPVGSNTGYKFVTSRTSTGDEYLVTDSSGNIKWEAKPKQYHQFEAYISPKSASFYNKYHSSSSMGHSNKPLNTSLGVTTMPTSVLNKNIGLHSFLYLPANVNSVKIHYMAWHSNAGTQSVNFRIAECPVASGSAAGVLTEIAAITDSIDNGKVVVKDVSCVTTTTGGPKVLIIYGAGPATGAYYMTANMELTVT